VTSHHRPLEEMSSHFILDGTIFRGIRAPNSTLRQCARYFIGRNTDCHVDFHHFGKYGVNALVRPSDTTNCPSVSTDRIRMRQVILL
jgi:hypothetical protein